MIQRLRRSVPFIILIVSLLFFSACGDSLQKPTGLEGDLTDEATVVDSSLLDDEMAEADEKADNNADVTAGDSGENGTAEDKETKSNEKEKERDAEKNSPSETKKKQNNNSKTESSNSSSTKQSAKSSNKSDANKRAAKSTSNKSSSFKEKPKANAPVKPKDESNSGGKKPAPPPKKDTVTISIVISSSEVPLSPTKIEIEPDDKVLDVFYKATNGAGIQQSVRGAAGTAYIEGIANVYEFDRGQGSGWMYRINGVFPDRGVGVVPVENGDRIELLYTIDLGKDLNANLQPFRR